MSNLTGTQIQNTYGGVINIGPSGATGSLQPLTDGFGTTLPIEISTSGVNFTGTVTGVPPGPTGPTGAVAITNNVNNFVLTAGGTGNDIIGESLLIFDGSVASPRLNINGICIGRAPSNNATTLAIGPNALSNFSSGTSVIAIGSDALLAQSSGSRMIAIGDRALSNGNNPIGDIIAIGHCAAQCLTGGCTNIVIGNSSLRVGDLGACDNVVIGGFTNFRGGSANIIIGRAVGTSTQFACDNVGIGDAVFLFSNNICRNIAIGCRAGRNLQNTERNILIGTNAGCSISSGQGNVYIGGATGGGLTTNSCNIVISDGFGNIKYFVNGSDGNTGINTTTPTETLDINGDLRVRNAFYDSKNSAGVTGGFLSTVGNGTEWLPNVFSAYYLSAFDDTDQTNAGATAANFIKYGTVDFSSGISIVSNSRITIANAGKYNIQFSAQFQKTSGGEDNVDVWLVKNGTNVSNSNTRLTLSGNPGYAVAAWNFLVDSADNDYYEIAWSSADTTMEVHADPSGTDPVRPAIPSVILSVVPV